MIVHITAKSRNSKTGPIPTTVSGRDSCPAECPLLDAGCYAQAGFHTRMHWDRVSTGERGLRYGDFILEVSKLPAGTLWRHNVAGDLPKAKQAGRYDSIDRAKLDALASAASHTRGFTYTHYALTGHNVAAIASANRSGFAVNVSCDTVEEVNHARARGLPAVVILPEDSAKVQTLDRVRVVRCPATVRDTTCADCGLCADITRDYAIGFPVHGNAKRKVIPIKVAV